MKEQLQKARSDVLKIPSYWCGNPSQIRVPWHDSAASFLALLQRAAVHPTCDGRDGIFCINQIQKVKVWRVENEVLWRRYSSKLEEIQMVHSKRRIKCTPLTPPVPIHYSQQFLSEMLQWPCHLNTSCNEVLLWHGTRRENVDVICKEGMDERVCQMSGMFGAG